jgi:hypothetical protein
MFPYDDALRDALLMMMRFVMRFWCPFLALMGGTHLMQQGGHS